MNGGSINQTGLQPYKEAQELYDGNLGWFLQGKGIGKKEMNANYKMD